MRNFFRNSKEKQLRIAVLRNFRGETSKGKFLIYATKRHSNFFENCDCVILRYNKPILWYFVTGFCSKTGATKKVQ